MNNKDFNLYIKNLIRDKVGYYLDNGTQTAAYFSSVKPNNDNVVGLEVIIKPGLPQTVQKRGTTGNEVIFFVHLIQHSGSSNIDTVLSILTKQGDDIKVRSEEVDGRFKNKQYYILRYVVQNCGGCDEYCV